MKINQTWFRILAYSGVAGLAAKVGQFFGLTILALVLSPDNYGRFAVAQLVATGFVSIVSSSFAIAANRKFAKLQPLGIRLISSTAVYTFGRHILIVATIATVFVPALYWLLSGGEFSSWVIPWAFLTASTVLLDVISGSLAGSGAVRVAGILDATRMLAIGMLALGLGSVFGYVGAAFGLIAFDATLAFGAVLLGCVQRKRIDRPVASDSSNESTRTVGAGVISNGVTQVASLSLTWAIQASFGLSAVGAFSVASRFASLVLIVPGLMSRNSLGYLARHQEEGNEREQNAAILIYLSIVSAVVVLSASIVVPVVTYVFPSLVDDYDGFWAILGVLLVASMLRAVATALGIICVSWGLLRVWIVSDVIATILALSWIGYFVVKGVSVEVLLVGSAFSAAIVLLIRAYVLIRRMLNSVKGSINV